MPPPAYAGIGEPGLTTISATWSIASSCQLPSTACNWMSCVL